LTSVEKAPLRLAAALRARKVLHARDYPWCFFSEKALKSFLLLENE
jgi:hypothetical protein